MSNKKSSRPGKDKEVTANVEVFCSSCLRQIKNGEKYIVGFRPAVPQRDKRKPVQGGWVPVRLCAQCK